MTVTAYGAPNGALDEALEICGRYEKLFSRTLEGSDIWRVNHADGKSVELDSETALLLDKAAELSELTEGAFDITVAAYTELWDFKEGIIPSNKALSEAAKNVGWKRIRKEGCCISLDKGMAIDLGGIAKGYIADRLSEYFQKLGVSAVINLGGDITTSGEKTGGEWTIGIRDPDGGQNDTIACLKTDKAAVTSGIYERGFDRDGIRYHHILDPATGFPAENSLASVTVTADSAAMADALSTALMVLGMEKGRALIDKIDNAEAVFITRSREIICTNGA